MRLELGAALGLEEGGARGAQITQLAQPPLVALAPGRDAPMQPVRLGLEMLLQPGEGLLLLGHQAVAPGLEARRRRIVDEQPAAIQPPGPSGDVGEKRPVVADHHARRPARLQRLLEPADGRQVEMVGGLVEQQNVRLGDQRPGDRDPAPLAAGEALPEPLGIEPQILQQHRCPMLAQRRIGIGGKPEQDALGERALGIERRVLLEIADQALLLAGARARVELDHAGQHLHQAGLAAAVAADEADGVTRLDIEIDAGEQPLAAQGQRRAAER